ASPSNTPTGHSPNSSQPGGASGGGKPKVEGAGPGGASPKIMISSRVKENNALLKEARKLSESERRGIDSILEQINKGNMNPGSGTKVFDGITEFRHRNGGRIYAKVTGDKVEILGYSGKGNQQTVINLIKSNFKGEL
ncbi:MAG: hypothetical protein FWC18_05685, partial [Cystobacterineae bacterium]|nr:hypothetical protein [Cystobacterineae bacterium]MCL2259295.1 hypothetical protein [Cystobacterineae bacterium]